MKTLQEQLLLAPQVAARAHQHILRKDGTPYIAHPFRVMMRAESMVSEGFPFEPLDGIVLKIVCLLHDVVEDTDITIDDLRDMGFSQVVLDGVDAMSKRSGEKYADFIVRLKSNPYARVCKLADIDDNMEDQSALDPDEAAFLNKRYTKAQAVLNA